MFTLFVVKGCHPPAPHPRAGGDFLHTHFVEMRNKNSENKTCVTSGGIQDGTVWGFLAVFQDRPGS